MKTTASSVTACKTFARFCELIDSTNALISIGTFWISQIEFYRSITWIFMIGLAHLKAAVKFVRSEIIHSVISWKEYIKLILTGFERVDYRPTVFKNQHGNKTV
jgi:hypothetical protein